MHSSEFQRIFAGLTRSANDSGAAVDWQRLGDALILWAVDDQLEAAIKAYQQAVATEATTRDGLVSIRSLFAEAIRMGTTLCR